MLIKKNSGIFKAVTVLLILFALTGCKAKYDLEIKGNGIFIETITGTVTEKELDNADNSDTNNYLYALDIATPLLQEDGQYIKDIVDKGSYKEFTFTYQYNNDFLDSRILNTCFDSYEFKETDDYYYFSAYGDFKCSLSNNIKVNVTSDYAVLENNASRVKGNTYTWNIKKDKNVDLFLVVSKNIEGNANRDIPFVSIFEIIGFIILIVLIVCLYLIYKKRTKDNVN